MASNNGGKKPALTSQAAKILEQYRNAGKATTPLDADGNPLPDANVGTAKPNTATPPSQMRRSGTRGQVASIPLRQTPKRDVFVLRKIRLSL